MALSFFPFVDGDLITGAILNELIIAIQNGSIFTSTSFVGDLITTLDARVAALESDVAALKLRLSMAKKRDQFILTAQQAVVNLTKTPVIDGELVFLNGVSLSRSGLPNITDTADYTISSSVITLETDLALQIVDDDKLTVVYDFEVTT